MCITFVFAVATSSLRLPLCFFNRCDAIITFAIKIMVGVYVCCRYTVVVFFFLVMVIEQGLASEQENSETESIQGQRQ